MDQVQNDLLGFHLSKMVLQVQDYSLLNWEWRLEGETPLVFVNTSKGILPYFKRQLHTWTVTPREFRTVKMIGSGGE